LRFGRMSSGRFLLGGFGASCLHLATIESHVRIVADTKGANVALSKCKLIMWIAGTGRQRGVLEVARYP
jgi:hypothetical protein